MLKSLLPALMMLAFSWAHGQKSLQPGYIIKLNGEKADGYIYFRDWEKNPRRVTFKEGLEGQPVNYSPLQLKSFGTGDKSYESAIVSVDDKIPGAEKYGYSEELKYRTDTVFLEAVFSGPKSLYYYKDRDGVEHYFIKKDSGFEWLIYKQYMKDLDGNTGLVSNDQYIQQLIAYLGDCAAVRSKFTGLIYSQQSLGKVFKSYYQECANGSIKFEKKRDGLVIQTGVLAGISSTKLKFKNSTTAALDYLSKASFSSSTDFTGGLFLNFVLPRNLGKWSIVNELTYTSFEAEGTYNDYHNDSYYILYKSKFAYSQIRLNDMLRYKVPVSNMFVYLNAGITNGFAISETNTRNKDTHNYGILYNEDSKAIDDSRKYEQGYLLGLGCEIKKFSIDARYEHGNGMSKISSLGSQTTKLYLIMGYRF